MSHLEKFTTLWKSIPQLVSSNLALDQQAIIKEQLELFHIGAFCYLLFDTRSATLEYVHPDVENVLGIQPEDLTAEALFAQVHPDDIPYFHHYEQCAIRFFSELPPEHRMNYKFSYDYRFQQASGSYIRILQQTLPLAYFAEGGARTLVVFTDVTHLHMTGIPKLSFHGRNGAPSYYNAHLLPKFRLHDPLFSEKEQHILQLMLEGKTSEEIALLLHRSIHTINNHRKNILQKSGCESWQALLIKAAREGWTGA